MRLIARIGPGGGAGIQLVLFCLITGWFGRLN
jgi:hypothetical protein